MTAAGLTPEDRGAVARIQAWQAFAVDLAAVVGVCALAWREIIPAAAATGVLGGLLGARALAQRPGAPVAGVLAPLALHLITRKASA